MYAAAGIDRRVGQVRVMAASGSVQNPQRNPVIQALRRHSEQSFVQQFAPGSGVWRLRAGARAAGLVKAPQRGGTELPVKVLAWSYGQELVRNADLDCIRETSLLA